MSETIHVVRPGESLSSIAQRHYGSARLWPSIYSFTNVLAGKRRHGVRHIVNPNRIHAGDRVALPAIPAQARWSIANDRGPAQPVTQLAPAAPPGSHDAGRPQLFARQPEAAPAPSTTGASGAGNPAASTALAPFYGWVFKLDDLKPFEATQNGLKITVTFKGDLTIQPEDGTPLIKLSTREGQIDLQRDAEGVMGQLLTDYQLTYDGATGGVKFACKMTQVGQAGAPNIGFGVPMPPELLQEFITYKPFRGTLGRHGFLVSGFTVEVTISLDPQLSTSPLPEPLTTAQPAPARSDLLASIDWTTVGLTLVAAVIVVSAGLIFFPGTALAAAALVVGAGLGASALWDAAEAKGPSGPIAGRLGSGGYGPPAVIDVYTTRPRR